MANEGRSRRENREELARITGKELSKLRTMADMSRKEVGAAIRKDVNYVLAVEDGNYELTFAEFVEYASALGDPVEVLRAVRNAIKAAGL